MLTFATPLAFAAGVKLSVPLSEISGRIKNSASLSVTAEKSSVCVLSFAGPAELKLAHTNSECAPESCATVTSAPLRKRGASLTELWVMVNVCAAAASTPPFAVPPLSASVTVTVATPNASAAGVKLSSPPDEIAGCTRKREGSLATAVKSTAWLLSPGAALTALAQPATSCAGASSLTATFKPAPNEAHEERMGAAPGCDRHVLRWAFGFEAHGSRQNRALRLNSVSGALHCST